VRQPRLAPAHVLPPLLLCEGRKDERARYCGRQGGDPKEAQNTMIEHLPALLPVLAKKRPWTEIQGLRQELIRRRPTLPRRCQRSTIGAGGLNFRVRDGNGCDPSATVTGNSNSRTKQRLFGQGKSYGQASRPISTGKLHALPRFHTQPITW